MRLALPTVILACIVAAGPQIASAQAANDHQADDTTVTRAESMTARAPEGAAKPANVDNGVESQGDRGNTGPVRWMAPEALNKPVSAATPEAGDRASGPQTRENGDDGRTDKSEAARARLIHAEPCPVPQPGGQ